MRPAEVGEVDSDTWQEAEDQALRTTRTRTLALSLSLSPTLTLTLTLTLTR